MAQFLTPAWFDKVEELTAAAGDLEVPPALANTALNLTVADTPDGAVDLSLANGRIQRGRADNAQTTITLDADTLRKVFLEFDTAAAMQAFMSGKIKVAGDMTQLMALQTARPSQKQKDLFKQILGMTE